MGRPIKIWDNGWVKDRKDFLSILLYWLLAIALITVLLAWRYVFMGLAFIKAMSFFAAVEASLIIYLIQVARGQAKLPRLNWINIAMAVFLVVLGVTTVFSVQPYVSFWGSSNRILGLVTWAHLGVLFYILSGFIREKKDWTRLLNVTIWASIPVTLYGLGQYFGISFLAPLATYRVESIIGNPVFLAGYLVLLIPVTFFSALTASSRIYQYSFIAALLLQVIVLVLSGTRGGLVTLAAIVLVLLLSSAVIYKRKVLLLTAGICVVLMGSLFLGVRLGSATSFVQDNVLLRRISEIRIDYPTSQTRLLAWQQGLVAWQERPLLGWGLENYSVAQNLNYKPLMEQYSVEETWFDRAHNAFVDLLVMTGILGFLAYLFLLVGVFVASWKMARYAQEPWQRTFGLSIWSTAWAYVIFIFFAFDTITSLAVVMMLWAMVSSQVGRDVSVGKRTWMYILVPLVLVSFYPFVARNVLVNRAMGNAIIKYYKQDFEQAFKFVDSALAYDTFLDNGIRSKLLDFSYDAYSRADSEGSRATIEPYLVKAGNIAKDTVLKEPYSALYYTRLLHLYVKLVAWDENYLPEGEAVLQILIKTSPGRPGSYMVGGHLYNVVGEYVLADEYYDKAIELYPVWGEPYYHKGIVKLKQKRIAEAEGYFVKAQELGYQLVTFQNLNIIAGILESQGDMQLAEEYRARIVKELPEEIDGYIELAKFYYRRGKIDLAYDYLVQALKYDPNNELANNLIAELGKTNPKYEIPTF